MPLPKEHIYTAEDYWNLPNDQRAELIDGQLYNMAPPSRIHQKLIMELSAAIHNYIKSNSGDCEVYPAPFAVNLNADEKIYVEPDISVICDSNKLTDKGCIGAPDFIIEVVSPSSQRMDYMTKLFKYRTAGVREYWIVNPMTETVQTYFFDAEEDSCQYSFPDTIHAKLFSKFETCITDLIK